MEPDFSWWFQRKTERKSKPIWGLPFFETNPYVVSTKQHHHQKRRLSGLVSLTKDSNGQKRNLRIGCMALTLLPRTMEVPGPEVLPKTIVLCHIAPRPQTNHRVPFFVSRRGFRFGPSSLPEPL